MTNPSNHDSGRPTPVRPTPGLKLGLLLAAGLAFGACTAGTDSDTVEDGAPVIGSAPVNDEVEEDPTAEPVESIGSDTGSDTSSDGLYDTSSFDDAEPDDLAMVQDREISEAPATEPEVEEDPEVDEDGDIDVPQAELGPGESVLCASVQIGLDAIRDGADDLAQQQRDRLIDGSDSIADRRLADLLDTLEDDVISEALLSTALDRCEGLGYES